MPACLAFDFTTGRCAADGQVVDRERAQPKMIMMQAVATRRAWTAVAGPLKIIDCLLEPKLLGIACRALGKHRQGGGDVIGCPVMPGAGRRVGIITEKGPVGASLQFKGGDRSASSHVKRRGIADPSAKAVEFSRMSRLLALLGIACVYRKLRLACSGDAIRRGVAVT
jgi:hypothetical protein